MYIKEILEKYKDKKVRLYLDMDGTIVDYDFGNPDNYDTKRPLMERINKLKEIIKLFDNVELYILTICHKEKNVLEKNIWLDKYIPEIKKDNRIIIIRDVNGSKSSGDKKRDYFNNLNTSDTIVFIDDDPRILKAVKNDNKNNVIIYKDSVLSD